MNTPTETQMLNELRFILISEGGWKRSYVIAIYVCVTLLLLNPVIHISLLRKVTSGDLVS